MADLLILNLFFVVAPYLSLLHDRVPHLLRHLQCLVAHVERRPLLADVELLLQRRHQHANQLLQPPQLLLLLGQDQLCVAFINEQLFLIFGCHAHHIRIVPLGDFLDFEQFKLFLLQRCIFGPIFEGVLIDQSLHLADAFTF